MTDPHRDNRPDEAALDGFFAIRGKDKFSPFPNLSERCGIPQ